MAIQYWSIYAAFGLGFAWIAKNFVVERRRNPRRLPLPPGPRGLPFLGNVLDIPQEQIWEGYHQLCRQYGTSALRFVGILTWANGRVILGDLVYLNALGIDILIVGSLEKAFDLLEKRANNYSDRPDLAVLDL